MSGGGSGLGVWYAQHVRPFLSEHAPAGLPRLDDEAARLGRTEQADLEIQVCVLGHAGVGKSTLMNALVAEGRQLLPAGGAGGPLTALEIQVRHAPSGSMEAQYHKLVTIHQIHFVLREKLKRMLGSAAPVDQAPAVEAEPPPEDLDESTRQELSAAIADEPAERSGGLPDGPGEGESARSRALEAQARLLITGSSCRPAGVEYAEHLKYLVDGLALALGREALWRTTLVAEDGQRIERIRLVLRMAQEGRSFRVEEAADRREYFKEVNLHAAGFLAPLIKRLNVQWPSPLLERGVVLVDLPGIGIDADEYRNVTAAYVRDKARAVILVVDNRGAPQALINLLVHTGYWERLVGAVDNPADDPCTLLMAVTRIDDLTDEAYAATADVEPRPRKRDIFLAQAEKVKQALRLQVQEQFQRIAVSDNPDLAAARQQALERLLGSLEIHPVSAPHFRRLQAHDPDDPTFLSTDEESGIPGLRDSLQRIAEEQRARRVAGMQDVTGRFLRSLENEIDAVESRFRDEQHVADADRLRNEIEGFVNTQRPEYDRRRAGLLEYLRATVKEQIRALVLEAKEVARDEIQDYLKSLQDCHWSTLRAAVRRGGVWVNGQSGPVNLPDEIADRFREPLAGIWSTRLLAGIRKRTGEFAQDTADLVGNVHKWARRQAGARIREESLRRQREILDARVAQLRQVGAEAVKDLRETVKNKIDGAIRKPIGTACDDFVKSGNDIGTGVKRRILEDLFAKLARDTARSVEPPATRLLLDQFEIVREEINKAINDWGDPLQEAVDAIVERHGERVRRGDVENRRRVLAAVAALRTARPDLG